MIYYNNISGFYPFGHDNNSQQNRLNNFIQKNKISKKIQIQQNKVVSTEGKLKLIQDRLNSIQNYQDEVSFLKQNQQPTYSIEHKIYLLFKETLQVTKNMEKNEVYYRSLKLIKDAEGIDYENIKEVIYYLRLLKILCSFTHEIKECQHLFRYVDDTQLHWQKNSLPQETISIFEAKLSKVLKEEIDFSKVKIILSRKDAFLPIPVLTEISKDFSPQILEQNQTNFTFNIQIDELPQEAVEFMKQNCDEITFLNQTDDNGSF